MKIGIIGPNKAYDGNVELVKSHLDEVAKILAGSGHEIVLTPDKDSLLEYLGEKYVEFGGKKIWLVIPKSEPDYSVYLNTDLGEIIDCIDWDRQANEFNRVADTYVCTGYSWGAMKEIACSQYFNVKKAYILQEFVSEKLPQELNFLVEYVPIDNFIYEI